MEAPLRRLAEGALLLLLAGGCSQPREGPPSETVTRDSAGIHIVETTAPAWGGASGFTVSRRPVLSIGEVDGAPEETFGYVVGAVRLSDGRVVVLDGQARALRAFAPDGAFLATWARGGEGPGEIAYESNLIHLPGDTVVAMDPLNRRASYFGPGGAFIRSTVADMRMRRESGQMTAQSCCVPLGAATDGSAVWRYPQVWPTEGPGRRPTFTTVVRLAPDQETLDTLGTFRAGIAAPWEGPNGVVPINFSPELHVAVRDTLVYFGPGDAAGYRVMDLRGNVSTIVRAALPRRAVTDEWLVGWKEREAARYGTSPELSRGRIRQILEREHADSLPVFQDVRVDPLGNVWLAEWIEPAVFWEAPWAHLVFDADGVWLGEVETPAGFLIFEIGENHLVGVRRGEFEEHYVEVYALER